MKKKFFLIAFMCCLFTGAAFAATITGTVINGTTSAPVSSQQVFVLDSLTGWRDTVVTNSSGIYSISLPSSVTNGHPLQVWTRACSITVMQFYTFSGSNITANFVVCTTSSSYHLHGTVSLGSVANNGQARLYLISKQYDTAMRDTTLTLVDTITTSTGGGYSKTYPFVPSGTLLLKAALLPSHPSFSSFLPTYYSSALVWSNATPLSAFNFQTTTTTDFTMIAGSNPGGSSFISGSVILGANKASAVGDPLPGRSVILTTGGGQAIRHTISAADGSLTFNGLTYGTYKIFGDAWGKINPALTFTLTANNSGAQKIIFEENDTAFRGRISSLLSVTSTLLANVQIYPNPAIDRITVGGLDGIGGAKSIHLTDLRGVLLQQQFYSPGAVVTMDVGALPAGVYLLRLETEGGTASFRIVK